MPYAFIWAIVFLACLIWSAIAPKDYFTWFLEVLPALIGAAILIFTFNRFKLTTLLYCLILIHCIILMVGGHYTYAEVPLFDWIKPTFGFERNNYDKVGHLAQGFIPVIIAREIFIRLKIINGDYWRNFLSLCFVLAFSAFYELIEWWVALLSGEDAEAFLGTQGYVWDTQSDMAWALIGGICALVLFGGLHDKQLNKISSSYG